MGPHGHVPKLYFNLARNFLSFLRDPTFTTTTTTQQVLRQHSRAPKNLPFDQWLAKSFAVVHAVRIRLIGVQLICSGRVSFVRLLEVEKTMWLARNEQGTLYHHGPLRSEDSVCQMGQLHATSADLPHSSTLLQSIPTLHKSLAPLVALACQSLKFFHRKSVLRNSSISLYIDFMFGFKFITAPC